MFLRNKKIKPQSPQYYRYTKTSKIKSKWYEKYGTASDLAGIIIGAIVGGFTIAFFYQTKEATKSDFDHVGAWSKVQNRFINDKIPLPLGSYSAKLDMADYKAIIRGNYFYFIK